MRRLIQMRRRESGMRHRLTPAQAVRLHQSALLPLPNEIDGMKLRGQKKLELKHPDRRRGEQHQESTGAATNQSAAELQERESQDGI
jgi:hypothetical protein